MLSTKLAQTTFQYYFALQSLQKLLPSTTLYYKACTNYFPVLLCTTKLAQNPSQYYFVIVLQSLHKALPSTTLYYKACTKHFPVLLCTTKLAQITFQYGKVFKRRSFYTQKLLLTTSFYAEKRLHTAFTHSKRYRQNTYTERFYTWQAFTHTASFLNREAFTHRETFTHNKLLHREQQAFTHSKRLHTEHLHTVLLHMASVYTHRNFYTETLLQKQNAQRNFLVHNHNRNCSSKTGSRRQSKKKTILKHFLKGFLKGKLLAPKLRKSADKSLSKPGCSHFNTIYALQLQKTIVLRMRPRHQATLTQPLQCVSQHHVANLHVSTHMATPNDNNHAAIPMRSATTDS